MTPTTPWSLRAWPPILWQAGHESQLRFHHLGTRVTFTGDRMSRTAGQTMWGGSSGNGDAGVAWDSTNKPDIFGGSREAVSSAGVTLRANALGFAVLQFDFARPFQRPGKGWVFQFSLAPGF